jgi:hypothetical protein
MYTITKEKFNSLHKDHAGTWSSDCYHGTNYDGLKTLLHWDNGTCLLIETIHFKIVNTEKENINPIKK